MCLCAGKEDFMKIYKVTDKSGALCIYFDNLSDARSQAEEWVKEDAEIDKRSLCANPYDIEHTRLNYLNEVNPFSYHIYVSDQDVPEDFNCDDCTACEELDYTYIETHTDSSREELLSSLCLIRYTGGYRDGLIFTFAENRHYADLIEEWVNKGLTDYDCIVRGADND